MKILKMEWRNLFSYGNVLNSIEFDDEGKLWQISGVSGSGKSSLLNLPKLLFYGMCEDAKGEKLIKSSISNRRNGGGWIKGTVQKGQDIYTIERFFDNSEINITKNNEPVDIAGSSKKNEFIIKEIMQGLDYDIYSNVVTLSLDNFQSFISMNPSTKRNIIDKIFSLEIINKISELIKDDNKEIGKMINTINGELYSIDKSLENERAELELVKSKQVDNIEERIAKYDEIINSCTDKLKRVDDYITDYSDKLKDVRESFNKANIAYNIATQDAVSKEHVISDIQRQINLFNEDKCPTCGTPFSGEHFMELKASLQSDYNKALESYNISKANLEITRTDLSNHNANIQAGNNAITALNAKRVEIQTLLNNTNAEKTSFVTNNNPEAITPLMNSITKNESEKKKVVKKFNEHSHKKNLLDILSEKYSKGDIKREFMAQQLPPLNEEIRETLKDIQFPYDLQFDEDFNAHLFSMGEEISGRTLSKGEGKRIDIVVLCAIFRYIKRKYPQINLISLDETISSLDYESASIILNYLKKISKDMGLNIFVVSHSNIDENIFDRKILAYKDNNEFTNLQWL